MFRLHRCTHASRLPHQPWPHYSRPSCGCSRRKQARPGQSLSPGGSGSQLVSEGSYAECGAASEPDERGGGGNARPGHPEDHDDRSQKSEAIGGCSGDKRTSADPDDTDKCSPNGNNAKNKTIDKSGDGDNGGEPVGGRRDCDSDMMARGGEEFMLVHLKPGGVFPPQSGLMMLGRSRKDKDDFDQVRNGLTFVYRYHRLATAVGTSSNVFPRMPTPVCQGTRLGDLSALVVQCWPTFNMK